MVHEPPFKVHIPRVHTEGKETIFPSLVEEEPRRLTEPELNEEPLLGSSELLAPGHVVNVGIVVEEHILRLTHGDYTWNAKEEINSSCMDKKASILADDIFKCIFLNENVNRILIRISLKFAPRSPIANKQALVRVKAWRRAGDKPLSEPMQICGTSVCVCLGVGWGGWVGVGWGGVGGGWGWGRLISSTIWNSPGASRCLYYISRTKGLSRGMC